MTITPAYPTASEIVKKIQALPKRTTGAVRNVRRGLSKQLANASAVYVLNLANELLEQPQFLYHFVAYELVHFHKAAFKSLRLKQLKQLGRVMNSWYHTDTFAPYLSGPAWREGQISDAMVLGWGKSKDMWWRRAALVSTIALNNKARGGSGGGDAHRTLAVCHLLITDRDDMIVKAMSWALRELAKRDPAAVKQFVTKHKAALAPRVIREVNNKLSTGLKNPKHRSAHS
jgi:3-methyladenine DNA glycosylase AlkD